MKPTGLTFQKHPYSPSVGLHRVGSGQLCWAETINSAAQGGIGFSPAYCWACHRWACWSPGEEDSSKKQGSKLQWILQLFRNSSKMAISECGETWQDLLLCILWSCHLLLAKETVWLYVWGIYFQVKKRSSRIPVGLFWKAKTNVRT